MTKKQRHFAYEGLAILFAGMFGIFAIPPLLNDRNSVSAVCGGMLIIGYIMWLGYYFYRAR